MFIQLLQYNKLALMARASSRLHLSWGNAEPTNRTAVPRQNYDRLSNQVHRPGIQLGSFTCKTGLMLRPLWLILVLFSRFFHSRRDLLLENLALRQQLGVLQRRRPQPRFGISDKFFWGILRRLWSGWSGARRVPRLLRPRAGGDRPLSADCSRGSQLLVLPGALLHRLAAGPVIL